MTILFDHMIRSAILDGEIKVHPFVKKNISAASLDLTLSNSFLIVEGHKTGGVIRMDAEIVYERVVRDCFILAPKRFVLASTVERITLPDYITASVSGRSSVGRMGLFVENAGWIDPGFDGVITLELYNANDYPIELIAGRRICQVIFTRGDLERDERAYNPYKGKYQYSTGTVGSKIGEDKEVSSTPATSKS